MNAKMQTSDTVIEKSSQDTSLRSQCHYRPSKPLPYELREHCVIYFEEGLCTYILLPPTTLKSILKLMLIYIHRCTSSNPPLQPPHSRHLISHPTPSFHPACPTPLPSSHARRPPLINNAREISRAPPSFQRRPATPSTYEQTRRSLERRFGHCVHIHLL